MTIRKVNLYECDGCGPKRCETSVVSEDRIPEGWITLTFTVSGTKHLCPACGTTKNIDRLREYEGMAVLDRERGD